MHTGHDRRLRLRRCAATAWACSLLNGTALLPLCYGNQTKTQNHCEKYAPLHMLSLMSNNLRNLPMLFIVSLSAFCGFEPERHVKPREHSRAGQATRNDIAQTAQIVVSGDDKNAR